MSLTAKQVPVYSFVIPLFNEEAVLPLLLHRLEGVLDRLDGPAEVILVDDGSTDTTGIFAAGWVRDNPRYRYVALSRNFGHQIAITAGLDMASGEAVVVMDADLQDPPEVALSLIAKWREGYEIVYAQRVSREAESWAKLTTAKYFYRALRKLTSIHVPDNVGDFRLIDRRALETFRAMPECDRYVRGMFGWMGFRQTAVPFQRSPRLAGETKYSWVKMIRLAFDAIIGFSDAPLRLALWLGVIVSAGALVYGAYVIMLALTSTAIVPGWASTVVVLSFLSGVNLMMTGVIGAYVGRIHTEVKNRPLYVVARAVGFAQQPALARPRAGAGAPARALAS